MESVQLAAFLLAMFGALLSPGPAFVTLVQTTFTGGRLQGVACALGLAAGATLWSLVAILGMTALFALVPWAYLALKVLGVAYLAWLAVHLWRDAAKPLVETVAVGRTSSFRRGLLINLANPKAVFFIASIFAAVFPTMPGGIDAALLLSAHFLLEVVFYSGCALAFGASPIRQAYRRAKAWLDRAAASVLGALAMRIATDPERITP